jgi:hypothetical protein
MIEGTGIWRAAKLAKIEDCEDFSIESNKSVRGLQGVLCAGFVLLDVESTTDQVTAEDARFR